MQLNKVLKGLLIAIPVLALTACGSTTSVDSGNGSANTNNGAQQTGGNNQAGSGNGDNVDVGTMTRAEELKIAQEKKQTALRQQHTLYFEYDKNTVTSEYGEMLSAHAAFLVKNPNVNIMIEGHCDERGTPEYNIALGERRAKAVAKYLTTLGVGHSQISMVSYGEEKSIDKSRTEYGFSKNRRAVLVY
jgi:peptidoglycan-associated lipoprotein